MFNRGAVTDVDDRSLDQNAHDVGADSLPVLLQELPHRLIALVLLHIRGAVIVDLVEPLLGLSDVSDPGPFENLAVLLHQGLDATVNKLIGIQFRSLVELFLLDLLLLLLFQ